MATAFELLSPELRRLIYQAGWRKLRPIQEAAIRVAFQTDANMILAAPTASGKTEAAYLPAISSVSDWNGVRILAISPLIALINDQFRRIGGFCESLHIPVTAWHGEANRSAKKKLLERPSGIVIITPESLEAMLDTRPGEAEHLFGSLEWIFVDELHAFLGTARGVQLRSLLERLRRRIGHSARFIGMSATLSRDSYTQCKEFFGTPETTFILEDKTKNPIRTYLRLHERDDSESLFDSIYRTARDNNLLVFPNSRRRVEEIANALRRRSEREGRSIAVFSHHSSVEKQWRKEAEEFARHPTMRFSICCTSTLELGIDIGEVDAVVQVDAPPSASSLSQRLGRSGRSEEVDIQTGEIVRKPSVLYYHATSDWSLLQGLAAISMVKRGELEASPVYRKPYDVLAHQLLAECLENSGMPESELRAIDERGRTFASFDPSEINCLIDHLIEEDYLERVEGEDPELITGLAAERVISGRDFYAMFVSAPEYDVVDDKRRIGAIFPTPEIRPGTHILLSARVWRILEIDVAAKKIRVEPAADGKAPPFGGAMGDVSSMLRAEMRKILAEDPESLPPVVADAIARVRGEIGTPKILQWYARAGEPELLCFAGTAAERALYLLLSEALGGPEEVVWEPAAASFRGERLAEGLRVLLRRLDEEGTIGMDRLEPFLILEEGLRSKLLENVKYAFLLPPELAARQITENMLDEEGARLALLDFANAGGWR